MKERLVFDGRVVGELKFPRRGEVLITEFNRDVVTKRISGKGYIGGHNTAVREGWGTSYPAAPEGAIAYWDDTEEGRFTGYDPAIMVVLPFLFEEVAAKFVADLREHTGWYSRPDHVGKFAERLEACLANGVQQFTPEQIGQILRANFAIIGNADDCVAAWRKVCALLAS